MICPRCRVRLNRATIGEGVFFRCPQCDGRAVSMALLRRIGSKESLRQLWQEARAEGAKPGAACPDCGRSMVEVALPIRSSSPPLRLDVCTLCEFVWFDPREFEQYSACQTPGPRALPEKAREAIAVLDAQQAAEKAEKAAYDAPGPDEWWQFIPAALGLPVVENAPALRHCPWLTYGLAAALVAVFALTVQNLRAAIDGFGLVPAELWRHGGLTFITSFFLHGGLLHLVGNVYFLLVFGDNVEDDLGRWRFVLLLAAADLFGNLLHVAGNPHSMAPCIGASGGISGVIAYYALRFPRARLGMMCGYRFYCGSWVHFPAYVGLLFWFGLQILLAFEQRFRVGSNVAVFAHLGGAAVGVAAWLLWRSRSVKAAQPL